MLQERKDSLSFCVNREIVYQSCVHVVVCDSLRVWVYLCLGEGRRGGLLENK